MEADGLRDQAQQFTDAGARILGISFDTPEENNAFHSDRGLSFPLLSDTDRSIGTAYGAQRGPDEAFADFPKRISYLIDPQSVIVKTYEVDDPGGHGAEVFADLQAALR